MTKLWLRLPIGCIWLRWWDESGTMLPWAVEQIEQERQRAEQLVAYLRSQGIDPDNLLSSTD